MNPAGGKWTKGIDVRDFILANYTPYDGDESFLASPTENTQKLWEQLSDKVKTERDRDGAHDIDEHTISTITSHQPGYINQELKVIVGVQTDEPLKRAIMPSGGIRLVHTKLETYHRELPKEIDEVFKHRKIHNDGVFDVYTDEIKRACHCEIIIGLPDAYGRGRAIGDYRRVALYGTAFLIEEKKKAKSESIAVTMDSGLMQLREELSKQIRAFSELTEMAASYGFDISKPASNTREVVQWLYFGYLTAAKEQNGAAMSLGRVSTFLDVYTEQDIKNGLFTEERIQEMVNRFVMELRIVRFLRTPDCGELFSGDPTWVIESLGGMALDGRHMVTEMTYRFLHMLANLGPALEPSLAALWSERLPGAFKDYRTEVSIETSSIQYENDDIMRPKYGDDYGIVCCVSAMRIGKQMQFLGARANLVRALLYAINDGKDGRYGMQVGPELVPVTSEYLEYEEMRRKFDAICNWLVNLYINTLNIIHYMHDKYNYERIEVALHDEEILHTMAGDIAGLSVVADSLSTIKNAKVKPIRNEAGLAVNFEIEGDYPKYGNNDPVVDEIAADVVSSFMRKLRRQKTYRNSLQTLSVLTITSNVVYGKKTSSTPDGRKVGEPLALGANPMHGRDASNSVASMRSVARLPHDDSEDGISYTFSIVPDTLGKTKEQRTKSLVTLSDGYPLETGHHINVNVFSRETLLDAMEHPKKYPQLTIRVSGYAVNFIRLARKQQKEALNRTFHEKF